MPKVPLIPCPFNCLHCGAHYLGIECSGKVGKQVPKWKDYIDADSAPNTQTKNTKTEG